MVINRSRRVTLATVASFATVLFSLRALLFIVGLGSAGWFVWSMIDTGVSSARALLPLSIMLWSALGLGIAYTLTRAPPAIAADDRLGRRIAKRLGQFGYAVAVVLILMLGGFALMLSIRAVDFAISWGGQ